MGPPNLERCHRAGVGQERRAPIGVCVGANAVLRDRRRSHGIKA